MATVTSLSTIPYQGQTFITFTKNAGSGAGTTYQVRRDTAQITSSSQGTLIATLDADSWHLLYDDTGGVTPRLSLGFVVPDGVGGYLTLANTQGLLVWTTASSGSFYYGVFTSDDPATVSAGNNTTTSAAVETATTFAGAVRLRAPVDQGAYSTYYFYRWEDYSTWKTSQWGYYGHRFHVLKPDTGSDFPIRLILHSAGFGYIDPGETTSASPFDYILIAPRDNGIDTTDPYTGTTSIHSNWFGRYDSVSDRQIPITERRITDYVQMVVYDLLDPYSWSADPNRIYVEGDSLGSGAMHVASHSPTLFAASATSIGYVDAEGYGSIGGSLTTLVEGTSIQWQNWEAIYWLAANGYAIPPSIHTYNKDDGTVHPYRYPTALTALEAAALGHVSQWRDGNHTRFYIDSDAGIYNSGHRWDLFRFKLNESYPAFTNSSASDAVGTVTNPQNNTGDPGNAGQRNLNLDWQSSLHTITGGSALSDTSTGYGISLLTTTGSATVDVTIRNAQSFRPATGVIVTWSTDNAQSGTASQNVDGTYTVQGLLLTTTALRLSLATAGQRRVRMVLGMSGRSF